MKNLIVAIALLPLGLLSSEVSAQDLGGALNPSEIGNGQVLSGMMRGHAERGYAERRHADRHYGGRRPFYAYSNSPSYSPRAAQTCANVPIVRARLGAGDPRVQKLIILCRLGGYSIAGR